MNNLFSALNNGVLEIVNETVFEFGKIIMISVLGIKVFSISYKLVAGKGINEKEVKQTVSGALMYVGYLVLPHVFDLVRFMVGI